MTHQRQLIRKAAATALTGNTAAGSRVFTSRKIPLRTLELPAVTVYALSESIDKSSVNTAPKELSRNLSLMIEALVFQNDSMDDAIDALAVQIERALDADETLGGTCSWSLLESVNIELFEDGQKEAALLQMTYQVRYYTYAPDASDVPLDDLDTIDVVTSIGGPNTPKLEDTITNLET